MTYTENTTPKVNTKLINFLSFENAKLKEELELRKLLSTTVGFYNLYFENLRKTFTREEAFHHTNYTYKSLFGEEKMKYEDFFSGVFKVSAKR